MRSLRVVFILLAVFLVGCSLGRPPTHSELAAPYLPKPTYPGDKRAQREDALDRYLTERIEALRHRRGKPAPRVSVVLKDPSLALVASTVRKATGWPVIFPASLKDRKAGEPFICRDCTLQEVAQMIRHIYNVGVRIDEKNSIVRLSETETVTFQVPVFNTYEETKNKLSVTEEQDNTSSSSGTGTGNEQNLERNNEVTVESSLQKYSVWEELIRGLQKILGKNGTYLANAHLGIVTVTTTPRIMDRVKAFMDTIIDSFSTQIRVKITIIEVQLSSAYERGVEWSRLFNELMKTAVFSVAGGETLAAPFVTFYLASKKSYESGTNINHAILQLLSEYGKTMVVSQPVLMLQNSYPAFFSVGHRVPYVATVTREYRGEMRQELVTPTMAYSQTGIVFSVTAKVIHGDKVLVQLSPILSSVVDWRNFKFEGIEFDNPEEAEKTLQTRAIIPSGRTLILGGLQMFNNQDHGKSPGVPGVGKVFSSRHQKAAKSELVILVTPEIIKGSSKGVALSLMP